MLLALALELLFAVDCKRYFIERFPVQQSLDEMAIRKPFDAVELVLEDAPVKVAGHADVERSR